MRLFLSYSRSDTAFVSKLSEDLTRAGHDVWLDRDDIRGGAAWRRSIGEGIAGADLVVVVLSPSSVSSPNVERELTVADEAGKRLLPLLAAPTTIPPGLSYVLAGVQHVDFTDRPYSAAFQNLLDALPNAAAAVSAGSHAGVGPAGVGSIGSAPPAARRTTAFRERGPTRLQLGVALGVVVAIAAFLSGMLLANRRSDPLAIGQFLSSPNCNGVVLVTGEVPKTGDAQSKEAVRERLADTTSAMQQVGLDGKAVYLDGDKSCFRQPATWLVSAGTFATGQQAIQACSALRRVGEFAKDPSIPLTVRSSTQTASCG